jgi:hypothetical protein
MYILQACCWGRAALKSLLHFAMWEGKEDVFLLRLKALCTLPFFRPAPFATCREAANHKALAVFSTVAQSTIGVRRRLAIAPLLKPLLNGVKVIEWSWISRIRMTLGSSFENHGPALSVTPGGNPLLMLLVMRSQTCLYSSLLEMLK